jgi:hypothetical protein
VPKENEKNKDAQQMAFKRTTQYFKEKFNTKPPGLNVLEKIHSELALGVEEKRALFTHYQNLLRTLGQWIA